MKEADKKILEAAEVEMKAVKGVSDVKVEEMAEAEIKIAEDKIHENPSVPSREKSDHAAKKNAKLEIKKLANEDCNLVRYYKGLEAIEEVFQQVFKLGKI